MKALAVNLALAAAGLLAALAVGEAAFRLYLQFRPDAGEGFRRAMERPAEPPVQDGSEVDLRGLVRPSPFEDIVYELRPNLRATFMGAEVRVNSDGRRDEPRPARKPPGVFRIVGLGDSVMFGWGVGQEETYLRVLEKRLNERAPRSVTYETLNFAVPGYNTAIEAAVLEHKALAYDPDLVVMQFVNNDYACPSFMMRPPEPVAHSRLLAYLLPRLARLLGKRGALDEELVGSRMRDLEGEEKARIQERYRYMVGEQGYQRAMERLARLVSERGIPVIVIRGTAFPDQRRTVRRLARRHGFRLLDVAPFTDDYVRRHGITDTPAGRREALNLPADPHPNARAHTIYADALESELGRMTAAPAEGQSSAR